MPVVKFRNSSSNQAGERYVSRHTNILFIGMHVKLQQKSEEKAGWGRGEGEKGETSVRGMARQRHVGSNHVAVKILYVVVLTGIAPEGSERRARWWLQLLSTTGRTPIVRPWLHIRTAELRGGRRYEAWNTTTCMSKFIL